MKTLVTVVLALALAAPVFAQSGGKIEITALNINSSYDDFASAFAENGITVFFTSDRPDDDADGNQKIFVSRALGLPSAIPDDVNDGLENGAVAVTPDGQYMIFAAYDRSGETVGRTDLYSARKVDGEWTDVENLGLNVNSTGWDTQPSLSPDGATLFFASDRDGGSGGSDIYVSRRSSDGSWGRARNLGAPINTSSDEMSPSIASDNSRFYFASNRSGGQGKFDIYTSTLRNDRFANPRNIGAPINTSADEYFYVALANSNVAYFSSDRSGGAGKLDIYSLVPNPAMPNPVRIVSGTVTNAINNAPLGARIFITDLATGERIGELQSDDVTGKYTVMLQSGRNYALTASADGYLFHSERFDVPAGAEGKEVKHDIELSPITGGRNRLLVHFDFDSDKLTKDSYPELNLTADLLKDNPDRNIVLEGHTDDVGSADYNKDLSLKRANSVKSYLVSRGVSAGRINTKGYGKERPIVQGTSDQARAQNRRVEMSIAPD